MFNLIINLHSYSMCYMANEKSVDEFWVYSKYYVNLLNFCMLLQYFQIYIRSNFKIPELIMA
jgi:hypothetical protein